jgi:hypothetical protein
MMVEVEPSRVEAAMNLKVNGLQLRIVEGCNAVSMNSIIYCFYARLLGRLEANAPLFTEIVLVLQYQYNTYCGTIHWSLWYPE